MEKIRKTRAAAVRISRGRLFGDDESAALMTGGINTRGRSKKRLSELDTPLEISNDTGSFRFISFGQREQRQLLIHRQRARRISDRCRSRHKDCVGGDGEKQHPSGVATWHLPHSRPRRPYPLCLLFPATIPHDGALLHKPGVQRAAAPTQHLTTHKRLSPRNIQGDSFQSGRFRSDGARRCPTTTAAATPDSQ